MDKNEKLITSCVDHNFMIFILSGASQLTEKICHVFNEKVQMIVKEKFNDGEQIVFPSVSVRDKNIFLIQSTSQPVDERLMELMIGIDSLKRASAKAVNVIFPYYGYGRQDRKSKKRHPITSKLVANLLTVAGAKRVTTIDVHTPQAQGFFDIPFDDMRLIYEICIWILENVQEKPIIVSPDYGGIVRAREIANLLGTDIAIIDKERKNGRVKTNFVLGEVKDRVVCLVDDMIDSGGTILLAIDSLRKNGAEKIYVIASHPVFSGNALERLLGQIEKKRIAGLVVSNTIELRQSLNNFGKLNVFILDISSLVCKIIKHISEGRPLSAVYEEEKKNIKKLLLERRW